MCSRYTNGLDSTWIAFLNSGAEGAEFKGTKVNWETWFMRQVNKVRAEMKRNAKKRKREEEVAKKTII